MGMNTNCQGVDENGKVAPMGATTDSSGKPATNVVAEIYNETVTSYEAFSNLTDTAQSKLNVDDATTVTISFSDLGSAQSTVAYVVFNYAAGTYAAALADSGLRLEIPIGQSRTVHFSTDSPLTTVYAISDDADPETGLNSLAFVFSRAA